MEGSRELVHVPCGCESRKRIMFTDGHVGAVEGVILGGLLLTVLAAYLYGRNSE